VIVGHAVAGSFQYIENFQLSSDAYGKFFMHREIDEDGREV
jgi:hypothetical protein